MVGPAKRPRLALSIGATLRAANDAWDGTERITLSRGSLLPKRGEGREAREETILLIGTINYKTLAIAARPVIANYPFSSTVLRCS